MKFPFYMQQSSNDCGPTCLKMVSDFYGGDIQCEFLRRKCCLTRSGTSMLRLSQAAESIGFETRGVRVTIEQLKEIVEEIPVIFHYNTNHFVVIYDSPKPGKGGVFSLADPAKGLVCYEETAFLEFWTSKESKGRVNRYCNDGNGNCLLLRPTTLFYKKFTYKK